MFRTAARMADKAAILIALMLGSGSVWAEPQPLLVTAYPAVDEIIKSAIPTWNKLHPDVPIKLVSREMDNHHTAMTTALSTRSNLPDVMALEFSPPGALCQRRRIGRLVQTTVQHSPVPKPLGAVCF